MNVLLHDLIDISKGKKVIEDPKGQTRYILTEDLRDDEHLKFTTDTNSIDVNENDIIIAWDGAYAGTVRSGLNGVIGSTLARIRLKEGTESVLPHYLMYFLRSKFQFLRDKAIGGGIPHVNRVALTGLNLYLPSITEQQKVVDLLNLSKNLILNRRASFNLIDKFLRDSYMNYFGSALVNDRSWPVNSIDNVCNVTKLAGYEYSKYFKYREYGDIIAIRGLNVKKSKLDLTDVVYIDKEISEELTRSKLQKGDVVMTYIGSNLGEAAIIQESDKFHLAPNVCKLSVKSKDELNPYYLLKTLEFVRPQLNKFIKDAGKPSINMTNIRKIVINLPPISIQNIFGNLCEKYFNIGLRYDVHLGKLVAFYEGISQSVFEDKLSLQESHKKLNEAYSDLSWFENEIKNLNPSGKIEKLQFSIKSLQLSVKKYNRLKDLNSAISAAGLPIIKEISLIRNNQSKENGGLGENVDFISWLNRITDHSLTEIQSSQSDAAEGEGISPFKKEQTNLDNLIHRPLGEVNLIKFLQDNPLKEAITIDSLQVNLENVFSSQFKKDEIKAEVFNLINAVVQENFSDTQFSFKSCRNFVNEKLFNISFTLVNEWIRDQIESLKLKQIYVRGESKESSQVKLQFVK